MLTIEEVHQRTGISVRNIKYWSRLYGLHLERRGRRNFYSEDVVRILEAVAALSALNLFTSHYLKWLVAAAQGRAIEGPGPDGRYRKYVQLHPSLAILPGLPPPPRSGYVPRDDW